MAYLKLLLKQERERESEFIFDSVNKGERIHLMLLASSYTTMRHFVLLGGIFLF